VVIGSDGLLEMNAKKIANQRHQSLKTAEIKAYNHSIFQAHSSHGQSLAD